jgi:uncharacterized repeat protein (TIGR03803 family)
MRKVGVSGGFALAVVLSLGGSCGQANAQNYEIIHTFKGGQDGSSPVAGVTIDSAGNLYGTTEGGGHAGCSRSGGCGTVFKIAPDGTESVLLAYDKTDGSMPISVPYIDKSGDLYVTTVEGGHGRGLGHGTLVKISPNGQSTVLYDFCQTKACPDGGSPIGRLIADKSGDLFGVAYVGGPDADGVIYEFTQSGGYQVFYAIGAPDASGYFARDSKGNFYVSTLAGGANAAGTIIRVSPKGVGVVLHQFGGGGDGAEPTGITLDRAGNLYGFTQSGGADDAGTVFSIDARGAEKVLYSFTGGSDGSTPVAAPILDKEGNIYGVTSAGGANGDGVVFERAKRGALKVLHDFTNSPDGAQPAGQVLLTRSGALYGTTFYGGDNKKGAVCHYDGCGTVYALKK